MPDNIAVVIVNSNAKRGLVDSEYNARRQQCKTGARFFAVEKLRDVALVPTDRVKDVRAAVVKHYEQQTRLKAAVYVCHASEGAGVC